MKRVNFIFETVLLCITLFFGVFILLTSNDFGKIMENVTDATIGDIMLFALMWLFLLGLLQVVHSLIIGISLWKNKAIRIPIIIYWTGVIIDFIVMEINSETINSNRIDDITFFIFPMILAASLWLITFSFGRKSRLPAKTQI